MDIFDFRRLYSVGKCEDHSNILHIPNNLHKSRIGRIINIHIYYLNFTLNFQHNYFVYILYIKKWLSNFQFSIIYRLANYKILK